MIGLLSMVLAGGVAHADARTRNVAIVIWNGAEVLDWAGPSEVFESAAGFGAAGDQRAFNVYTVSKTTEPIKSQRFVQVLPEYSIENAPAPDIIVLPGGGTSSVLKDPEFLGWAGKAAREAEVALSVCTGAFILGESGLLDGKTVTTWYGATDRLEQQFPKATVQRGSRFVDNGQIVTTAGVSAGIDGSLHVVARLLGRSVADRTAEYMEYRWTPESYLAQSYSVLNPDLDERGRRLQQAAIDLRAKNWPAAIAVYRELLGGNEADDGPLWFQLGQAHYGAGSYREAAEAFLKAAVVESVRTRAHYNAACSFALADDTDRSLAALKDSIASGFTDAGYMMQDPDLANLRGDPRFSDLLKTIPQ